MRFRHGAGERKTRPAGGRPLLQQAAQADVVHFQRPGVQGLVDRQLQFVAGEGFQQVGEGAQLHGRDRLLDRAVGGQHDDRRGRRVVPVADAAQDLHAVESRHPDIA